MLLLRFCGCVRRGDDGTWWLELELVREGDGGGVLDEIRRGELTLSLRSALPVWWIAEAVDAAAALLAAIAGDPFPDEYLVRTTTFSKGCGRCLVSASRP